MKFYTRQAIFDTVNNHLIEQGSRSCDDSGLCSYRGSSGASCAIGILIPDENYSNDYEENGIKELIETRNISNDELGFNASDHVELLEALQGVHDAIEVSEWNKLKSISVEELLSYMNRPEYENYKEYYDEIQKLFDSK